MNPKKLGEFMLMVFDHAQHMKNKGECIEKIITLFSKLKDGDGQYFFQVLIKCIQSTLTFDRKSPYTKRTLEFISALLKEISKIEESKENRRQEEIAARRNSNGYDSSSSVSDDLDLDDTIIDKEFISPPSFVDNLIRESLVKYTNCDNVDIRHNAVNLIRLLLDSFEEIEENTFFLLQEKLASRSYDIDKLISAASILSLNKLQDVKDIRDPALQAILFHLTFDRDTTVRMCSLRIVEVATSTIEHIIRCTRDTNVSIRKIAYNKIADHCKIENFSPEKRCRLLKNAINDRSLEVKDIVYKKLITNWIKNLDGDIVSFTEFLVVRSNRAMVKDILLNHFAMNNKIIDKNGVTYFHKLAFDFKKKFLNENKILHSNLLSEESLIVWYHLINFCLINKITLKKPKIKTNNMVENDSDEISNETEEEYEIIDFVDEISPDIPIFCFYIENFIKSVLDNSPTDEGDVNKKDYVEENVLFLGLLDVCCLFKVNDEAQWKFVLQTFSSIIKHDKLFNLFNHDCIEKIMFIFSNYFIQDDERFLDLTLDLINSINEKLSDEGNKFETLQQELNCLENAIKEKYDLLEEIIDEAVIGETKKEISLLESQRQDLYDEQMAMNNDIYTSQSQRMDTDPKILERLIYICYGYLKGGRPKNDSTRLPSIIDRIVLPCLGKSDGNLVSIALKTLGYYCLPSVERINYFLKVFIEIIYTKGYTETRIDAMSFLMDFLLKHGLEMIEFNNYDYKAAESQTNYYSQSGQDENILQACQEKGFTIVFNELVMKYLKNPIELDLKNPKLSVEHRLFDICVKGICKLLYVGRLYSEHILARLFVISTLKNIDDQLKQYIQGFFLSYCSSFNKYLKTIMDKADPFLSCYELVIGQIIYEKIPITSRGYDDIILQIFRNIPEELNSEFLKKSMDMLATEEFQEPALITALLPQLNKVELLCSLEDAQDMKEKLEIFIDFYKESLDSKKKNDKNLIIANKLLNKIRKYITS